MDNKSEPKRHHYIPQFILRNFRNDDEKLNYWDIDKQELTKKDTRDIFMNMNMYRDEINHKNDPTYIEHSLSGIESDVAKLIKEKILDKETVVIDRSELEMLRIYLGLQAFRDDYRKDQYVNKKFDPLTKKALSQYVVNDDYEDLWKREIEALSKCRSYEDIQKSKILDPIIKQDFMNLLTGCYMTICDVRGGELLISDVYPTLEIYPVVFPAPANIHLHILYPISPTRLLLLNNTVFKYKEAVNHPMFSNMIKLSRIKNNLIIPPKNEYIKKGVYSKEDKFIYKTNKIYDNDLKYINSLILNEARNGVMFKNPDKIISSVYYYGTQNNKKNNYDKLIKTIEK